MKLLKVEEVAAKLQVKVCWVMDRTRQRCPEKDRIPCIKMGHFVRFNEEEIDAWLERGCKPVSLTSPKIRTIRAVSQK